MLPAPNSQVSFSFIFSCQLKTTKDQPTLVASHNISLTKNKRNISIMIQVPSFIIIPACGNEEIVPPPPALERWSSEGSTSSSCSNCSVPPMRPQRQASIPESLLTSTQASPDSSRTFTSRNPESAPRLPLRSWADDECDDDVVVAMHSSLNLNRWAC